MPSEYFSTLFADSRSLSFPIFCEVGRPCSCSRAGCYSLNQLLGPVWSWFVEKAGPGLFRLIPDPDNTAPSLC